MSGRGKQPVLRRVALALAIAVAVGVVLVATLDADPSHPRRAQARVSNGRSLTAACAPIRKSGRTASRVPPARR